MARKAPVLNRRFRGSFAPQKLVDFVEEYMKDYNPVRAVRRAGMVMDGYSAFVIAHYLIELPRVKNEIADRRAYILEKYKIDRDKILEELMKIGFSNIANYHDLSSAAPVPDFTDVTEDQYAAISELTTELYTEGRGSNAQEVKRVKIKLYDKPAALVQLGKHVGLFDRPEGDDGPVQIIGGLPEPEPLVTLTEPKV